MSTLPGSVCTHGWTTPPECPSCMAIELDELNKRFERLLEDGCDTDSSIRETLRPLMDVEGDSYAVPPIEDLVQQAAKELESLRQENSRLREALATWLKWWDHEVSGTEKGRIYRWTEELLNPPKRS